MSKIKDDPNPRELKDGFTVWRDQEKAVLRVVQQDIEVQQQQAEATAAKYERRGALAGLKAAVGTAVAFGANYFPEGRVKDVVLFLAGGYSALQTLRAGYALWVLSRGREKPEKLLAASRYERDLREERVRTLETYVEEAEGECTKRLEDRVRSMEEGQKRLGPSEQNRLDSPLVDTPTVDIPERVPIPVRPGKKRND